MPDCPVLFRGESDEKMEELNGLKFIARSMHHGLVTNQERLSFSRHYCFIQMIINHIMYAYSRRSMLWHRPQALVRDTASFKAMSRHHLQNAEMAGIGR
jgi:hypothetical protein